MIAPRINALSKRISTKTSQLKDIPDSSVKRAHVETTNKPAVDSLSPRRRNGERVRERGFQMSATIRSPSPQPSPRSCLAGRGPLQRWWCIKMRRGQTVTKGTWRIFEAVNGGGRRNGDGPAAPIRIYCPATMRLRTSVAPWKETSRVPSGKKTDIVAFCVSSPDVSLRLRVAFIFT